MKQFGDRLKQLRGADTQAEFAKKLKISSPQTYGRYEQGRIPPPELLCEIANQFGVSLDWLFGLAENRSGSSDGVMCVKEAGGANMNGAGSHEIESVQTLRTSILEKFLELSIREKDYEAAQILSAILADRKQ